MKLCRKVECTVDEIRNILARYINQHIAQGYAKRTGINTVEYVYSYDASTGRWIPTIDYVRKVDPNVATAHRVIYVDANLRPQIIRVEERTTQPPARSPEEVIRGLINGYDVWRMPCAERWYLVYIKAYLSWTCKAGYSPVR